MEFVTLQLDQKYGDYSYKHASNTEMCILGLFFSDIGCLKQSSPTFQEWILYDKWGMAVATNTTFLEKDGEYIFLTEQSSGEEDPTELKMSRQQLVQLIDEWQGQVYKTMPSEVIIRHKNDTFIIESSN